MAADVRIEKRLCPPPDILQFSGITDAKIWKAGRNKTGRHLISSFDADPQN